MDVNVTSFLKSIDGICAAAAEGVKATGLAAAVASCSRGGNGDDARFQRLALRAWGPLVCVWRYAHDKNTYRTRAQAFASVIHLKMFSHACVPFAL